MPRVDSLSFKPSDPAASLLLRARILLPISGPPIEDGAVSIAGNRIQAIGRWQEFSSQRRDNFLDLGEVILLPGLVNAHCHLDYTAMAGQLAPPGKFTDWIKLITASKAGLTYSDFAASWLNGAGMLLRNGVTTVGDVEMVPELLPEVWTATPLRILSFLEMTGVKSRRAPHEILREALGVIKSLPKHRCRAGLSPHAPYSTAPELLRLAANAGLRHRLRVTTHVAESDQEFEMFTKGRGEMYDWLARNQRNMSDCGHGTPVQHLERHRALNENLLAVHVNYLGPDDATLLGKRKVSVAHCPRSHAYFGRQTFPFNELAAARVNICLATDSLASVYKSHKRSVELSLFDEMREFAARMPGLAPEKILAMATTHGAHALGMAGQVGELAPNAFADLIVIPHHGSASHAPEAAVHHCGNVMASMIDGQWAILPAGGKPA